jgi:nucleoside-diphosphate-sugar epimerase
MRILITGGAGFIGSNLARYLLQKGQHVLIFDDFSTGKLDNLEEIRDQITIVRGDIRDYDKLRGAIGQVEAVSHQAALGSVPRSVKDPRTTHDVNVNGTLNVLEAMRETGVKRIVFAASSSAYGKHEVLPKHEGLPAAPISPYAASKVAGELYMQAYSATYGIEAVCLRYFNVFGPRQDPLGDYAAVIPRFVQALLDGRRPVVYGDGEQSRDFCYVENACKANWLALQAPREKCDGLPINIACGRRASLNQLLADLQQLLGTKIEPEYSPARPGDVLHSLAGLERAKETIGYEPKVHLLEGLERSLSWYTSLR